MNPASRALAAGDAVVVVVGVCGNLLLEHASGAQRTLDIVVTAQLVGRNQILRDEIVKEGLKRGRRCFVRQNLLERSQEADINDV